MNAQWEYAEAALAQMRWPDWGENDRWRWWFHRTWVQLHERGWFEAGNDAGVTLVALRWLVEDFAALASGDGDLYEPDWDDWLEKGGVDRDAAAERGRLHKLWPEIQAELEEEYALHDVVGDDEDAEECRELTRGEIESCTRVQAPMLFVYEVRRRLVPVLVRGWGGEGRLFRSLWACGGCWAADAGEGEEHHGDVQGEADRWRGDLPLDARMASAINEAAEFAVSESITLGDPDDMGRSEALQWAMGRCPLVVSGSPALLLITHCP